VSLASASGLPASACDLCAVYTATQVQQSRTGPRLAVAEQFTHFGTLQDGGAVIENEGEHLDSAITQLLFGYNINERFGLQLNLPIISRTFTRFTDGGLEHGDESGVGDMLIVGTYSPRPWVWGDGLVRVSLLGGLKLPTGDASRLAEELEEDHAGNADLGLGGGPGRAPPQPQQRAAAVRDGTIAFPAAVALHAAGGQHASGIHGHDLALGSGSVDGIVGARLFGNWKRLFASGSVQYFIRSQGSFNYQYANDLLWRLGPGVFLALDETGLGRGYTLGLSAIFSGETKGLDRQSGGKLDDTGSTALYLGPALTFTWGENLQASIAGAIPVMQNNTSIQIVQDYRISGALTWRF